MLEQGGKSGVFRARHAKLAMQKGQSMFSDDELPKPGKTHEIGCDLTFLSAAELDERIAVLKEEIARLEADKTAKTSSRAAAESFFR